MLNLQFDKGAGLTFENGVVYFRAPNGNKVPFPEAILKHVARMGGDTFPEAVTIATALMEGVPREDRPYWCDNRASVAHETFTLIKDAATPPTKMELFVKLGMRWEITEHGVSETLLALRRGLRIHLTSLGRHARYAVSTRKQETVEIEDIAEAAVAVVEHKRRTLRTGELLQFVHDHLGVCDRIPREDLFQVLEFEDRIRYSEEMDTWGLPVSAPADS